MHLRGAWLMAAGVVLALVTAGLLVMARAGAGTDRCAQFRGDARERASLVTGAGRDVLVVGDSYAVGLGVEPSQSWPVRLPGRVRVDGFSGSGFSVAASPCGNQSYAARVSRAPRGPLGGAGPVVVEGGLNDTDQPEAAVRDGFEQLMTGLRGRRVLVVGPAPAPARRVSAPRVDGLLTVLSRQHGVGYLSLLDADLAYLDDGLHLTPAGHRELGDLVAAALSTARRPGR